MLIMVVGAPGSGKTSVTPSLRSALPTHVVFDWDALMYPAGELAGCDITKTPTTWPLYRDLLLAVVLQVLPRPMVILGVTTPDLLENWPPASWICLDCTDDERQRRLRVRGNPVHTTEALADAARLRSLGFRTVDTTGRSIEDVAAALAQAVWEGTSAT